MVCNLALNYQDLNGARSNMSINNGQAFMKQASQKLYVNRGYGFIGYPGEWEYCLKSLYWS